MSSNSEPAPASATSEELNVINEIKEECMTKQGGVWYYDEDKAKTFLRAHVQHEVDDKGIEMAARYIKANVVPTPLRQAISDCLAKPLPNIIHLCALDAGWTNKEMGQEEQIEKAVEEKAESFLEALNHIVYTGSQNTPIYKTEVMKAKTEMAKVIREMFVQKFNIPKEKIENYTPPDDLEVDGVDADE